MWPNVTTIVLIPRLLLRLIDSISQLSSLLYVHVLSEMREHVMNFYSINSVLSRGYS